MTQVKAKIEQSAAPAVEHPVSGLPTLMGLLQTQLLSFPVGLKSASSASPSSKPSSVTISAARLPRDAATALCSESSRRNEAFLEGLARYQQSPLPGPQVSDALMESFEHVTLRHYPANDAKAAAKRPLILCVPSLINRYSILDISPRQSLVRFLSQELGLHATVVDWGEPEEAQAEQSMAHYAETLIRVVRHLRREYARPIVLLGYCMGGVLAVAAAQLCGDVKGMALLATPWDYAHYPTRSAIIDHRASIEQEVERAPLLEADKLQSLFYLSNPLRVYRRYSTFAAMQQESEMRHFVAVEHWANDGVSLVRGVARECLVQWPCDNVLAAGDWKVENQPIKPDSIGKPAFVAIPHKDTIVPREVANSLALLLPQASVISPSSGHVGMLVGTRARAELWLPLANWLEAHFPL